MIEVTFLENTWIRTSIAPDTLTKFSFQYHVLGYIRKGRRIIVEEETVSSIVSISDVVNNVVVSSNLWYVDKNGWFYWKGSTRDSVISKYQVEKFPNIDWASISYNKAKMNLFHRNSGIIETLWRNELVGSGIKVAILDTGLNTDLGEFQRLDLNNCYNAINQSKDIGDEDDHGTLCALIQASRGYQYFGIAPRIDLYICKIARNIISSSDNLIVRIIRSINWAERRGVRIISLSYAISRYTYTSARLITEFEEVVNRFFENDGIVICSAGNIDNISHEKDRAENGVTLMPASFENVIAVGCSGSNNNSLNNSAVDIYVSSENLSTPIKPFSDSSCACAVFAGVYSILKQKYKEYNNKQLSKIIKQYVKDKSSNREFKIDEFINWHYDYN